MERLSRKRGPFLFVDSALARELCVAICEHVLRFARTLVFTTDKTNNVGAFLTGEVREKGKLVERRGRKANEAKARERYAGRVAERATGE
jgi:hypothetical protein